MPWALRCKAFLELRPQHSAPCTHSVHSTALCVSSAEFNRAPLPDKPSPGSVLLARSTPLPRSWAPRPFLSRLSQLPVPPLLSSVTESAKGRGQAGAASGTGTGPAYMREAFFLPPSHGLEVLARFCVVPWPSGACCSTCLLPRGQR